MKSTLFVYAILLILLIVSPGLVHAAGTLTCKDIENSSRDEYFMTSTKKAIDPVYQESLIRKSAAMFLGIDTSKIPMKRLEKLAEDPATEVVEDPLGRTYALAQIGFGGGNSINYYYKFGNLELLPVALYDGDCIEQGSDESFPIEVDRVDFNGTALMTCTVADPESPVSDYTVRVSTEDGNYTGSKADVTATLNSDFENLTTLAKAQSLRRKVKPSHVTVVSKKYGKSMNVSFRFNNRQEGERIIELKLTARDKADARVWGKVFTNKVGGFHAEDSYDFNYPAVCVLTGNLTGKLFKRFVKY